MLTEHQLPNCNGPKGGTLFVDVAQLGADNPKELTNLDPGTHGVEGFCGSVARLDILPTGCTKRCLLTHAYYWSTR